MLNNARIHIAGHSSFEKYTLDTHDHAPIDPVWKMYGHALEFRGSTNTLLEWDAHIPSFSEVHREALKANRFIRNATMNATDTEIRHDAVASKRAPSPPPRQTPKELREPQKRALTTICLPLGPGGKSQTRWHEGRPLRVEYEKAFALAPQKQANFEGLNACLDQPLSAEQRSEKWGGLVDANPPQYQVWDGYAEFCLFLDQPEKYRKARTDLLRRRAADDAFAKELPCVAFLRGRSVGPEFRAPPASRAACVTAIGAVGKCRGYEKIAIARHGA